MYYKKSLLLGIILLSAGLLFEYAARVIHHLNRPPIGPTLIGTVPGISLIALGLAMLLYSAYQYKTTQTDESDDVWRS